MPRLRCGIPLRRPRDAKRAAYAELVREARMLGSNAVIGLAFDVSGLGGNMLAVSATAVAVNVEPAALD